MLYSYPFLAVFSQTFYAIFVRCWYMKPRTIFSYPYQLAHHIRNRSPGIRPMNAFNYSESPPGAANQRVTTQGSSSNDAHTKKFDKLILNSQKTLFIISSVFPFDLFPDQISIEPMQVNVSKKSFFATYHVQSIPLKNVADVFLQTSLFFATLKIIDSSYIENSIKVEYLPKDKACRARRIIMGLVIAMKENIDLSRLPLQDLALKAEQLGDAREVDLMD